MATTTTESRRLTSRNIEQIVTILAEKGNLPIEDAFGCVYDLLPKNLQTNHSGARVTRAVEEQKYDELSVPQLKDVCRRSGIKGFSKLKKDELLDLLTNAGEIEQEDFIRILIDNCGSGIQRFLDDEGKLTGRFEAAEGKQLNMTQLKEVARGASLKGYGNLKKAELISLLRGENSDSDTDDDDAKEDAKEDAEESDEEDADKPDLKQDCAKEDAEDSDEEDADTGTSTEESEEEDADTEEAEEAKGEKKKKKKSK